LIRLSTNKPPVFGPADLAALLARVGRVNRRPFMGRLAGTMLCLGVRTLGEKTLVDLDHLDPALSRHYPSADFALFDDWSRDHAA